MLSATRLVEDRNGKKRQGRVQKLHSRRGDRKSHSLIRKLMREDWREEQELDEGFNPGGRTYHRTFSGHGGKGVS